MKENLLTKSVGKIILKTGESLNKEHLINLGWYLSCKGGKRVLNDKFNLHVLKMNEMIMRGTRYTSANEIHFYWEKDTEEMRKLTKELNNSIGKAMVKKVKNIIFLLDNYEFYPWCGNYNHVNNCGCFDSDKEWAYVTIFNEHSYYRSKWTPIFKNILSINLFQHDFYTSIFGETIIDIKCNKKNLIKFNLTISTFGISFDIDISDEIFNNLGKPFYTVKRIILEE